MTVNDRARTSERPHRPRDWSRSSLSSSLAAALVVAQAATARADGTPKIVAEQLFSEGRTLLERGEVAPACAKLSESQQLDPAGGTALLLGICYETEAKLASAWSMLRSARALAVRQNRPDRVEVADAHLRTIEPQLAYLNVHVEPGADVAGLRVLLDDIPLNQASWNLPIPMDAGTHAVSATAPGYAPFAIRIDVPSAAGTTDVNVGPFRHDSPPPHRSLAPALTAGAATLVALGVTAYFGIDTFVAEGQKPASCSVADTACVSQWHALEDRRTTDAAVSTIAGGVALGAVAVAIVFLTLPGPKARADGKTPAARADGSAATQTGWTVVPTRDGGGVAFRF